MCKVLEDLLQRGLAHAVLSDSQLFPLAFDLTEQVANGLVLFGDSDLVEITTLFEELNLLKLLRKELDEIEATLLCEEELDQTL